MEKLTSWSNDPVAAFRELISTEEFAKTSRRRTGESAAKTISKESAKTYLFMFGNFVKWMLNEKKTIENLTHFDLIRFINRVDGKKRVLNSKIAFRYLRLLERCYDHLQISPNPARAILSSSNREELAKDAAGRALSTDQLQRFFDALPSTTPRLRNVTAFDGWKRRRDRTMQVVIALAGLRVSEATGLMLGEISKQAALDGSVLLTITPEEKHDTSYKHVTTLPVAGVNELRPWLDERHRMQIPGQFVFPANIAGAKMTKKTVYMQIRATFERAGLDLTRAGGRTLRNTFAKQQLEDGATADELKDTLGLALERSAAEYKFTKISADAKK